MTQINWTRFIKEDKATHPKPAQEIMVMGLVKGKPGFFPRAYFGFFSDEIFYEVLSSKGSVATKRKEHKVADFEDVAWVYLDVPSWWIDKKDQQ